MDSHACFLSTLILQGQVETMAENAASGRKTIEELNQKLVDLKREEARLNKAIAEAVIEEQKLNRRKLVESRMDYARLLRSRVVQLGDGLSDAKYRKILTMFDKLMSLSREPVLRIDVFFDEFELFELAVVEMV